MRSKGAIMVGFVAGMLLLQFGIYIFYIEFRHGMLPGTRADVAEMNAWVCAIPALAAAAIALSSFLEQRTWSRHMEQESGDSGPGGSTAPRDPRGTDLAAVAYIPITAIIAGWGVWTTLWFGHG